MKKIIFLFAPLCAMLMVGCVKDEPEEEHVIQLFAENYISDKSAKLAVKDANTYWVDGEKMWLNAGSYRIDITNPDGSGAVATSETNRKFKSGYVFAIYPFAAGPTRLDAPTSRTQIVKVPDTYDYKESGSASGSKQILDGLPMVAYGRTYSDASYEDKNNFIDALHFKHLTAAITVRVTNTSGDEYIEVEKIELINNKYMLCGNVKVTFDDNGSGVNPGLDLIPTIKTSDGSHDIPYKQNSPSTVTLNFNGNSPKIYTSRDFQIPILPVGTDDSKFTVKVYAKSYTSTSKGRVVHVIGSYPYVQSTNEGNKSIGRGCLGYAPITFNSEDKHDLFESERTTITLKDGSTVTGDFYKISSKEELKELSEVLDERENPLQGSADGPLFQNSNYIVTQDIDMGWDTLTPLHYYNEDGTERCYFYGNGKTISRFVASSVGENEPNCCGFFGRTAGDDITIEKLYIDSAIYEFAHVKQKIKEYDGNPCSAVGGIYACVDHSGVVIEDCHVNNVKMGSVGTTMSGETQTDFYAGGIVGVVFSSVTIRNCSVGSVLVDNSHDATSGALVDQFGAAVARIDVGDGNSSNTYSTIVDVNHGSPEDVPAVIIENFTYDQGATALRFVAGLRNVRYGGLVGNITRGGRLIMRTCSVNHNVVLEAKPSIEMFVSGLIGCAKIDRKMGLHLRDDCSITGTIVNNAAGFTDYSSDQYVISKYCSVLKRVGSLDSYQTLKNNTYIKKLADQGHECAITCTNTLTVSGNTTGFRVNDQTF